MSLRLKEWEIKMELIASVARSQIAMAKILESIADLSGTSPKMAKSIRENIRLLTGMQQTIAEKITGIRWGRPQQGQPGRLWLCDPKLAVSRVKSIQTDDNP
ncbi:hypothetical protein [Paenibacillus abyssi]|uniref:Uncharacterized protein n=1 Tax=Paenibacillus abyssi TaxID=1340531 RepID=A0A917CWA6_9BACL|nr:hypothetical protein [Paenibacillus abyssi]GGF98810.1 hypothetical protein GCM10010916_15100 [Paenibacillus abyssi]